jgi:hypothetical protein
VIFPSATRADPPATAASSEPTLKQTTEWLSRNARILTGLSYYDTSTRSRWESRWEFYEGHQILDSELFDGLTVEPSEQCTMTIERATSGFNGGRRLRSLCVVDFSTIERVNTHPVASQPEGAPEHITVSLYTKNSAKVIHCETREWWTRRKNRPAPPAESSTISLGIAVEDPNNARRLARALDRVRVLCQSTDDTLF